MHERQTQKLFSIVGVTFLLFLVVTAVYRSGGRRSVVTVGAAVLPDEPIEQTVAQEPSAVHLEAFHRVEIKDGKPLWEIKAREGHYFEGDELTQVSEPSMILYQEDGSAVSLRARSAKLVITEELLQEAQLEGDIVVTLPSSASVVMDHALYRASERSITTTSKVVFRGQGYELTGVGMELDLSTEDCLLRQDVTTYFEMGASGAEALLPARELS